jgi:hypothetical protein
MSALLSLLLTASLAPHLTTSTELVRLRNALLLQTEPASHEWTPAAPPPGFAIESAPPLPLYVDAVARDALRVEGDDWATALRIGRHLLVEGKRGGGPIQLGLEETYLRITTRGEGYCGDFADSFTGLATAAGLFSRSWAFSFDGYGGHGHIFNEIWDGQNGRWIMVDVFNNFYVVNAAGQPLSATAFRKALLSADPAVQLVPVKPEAMPGFARVEKAFEYYRRGLPEWYMWWGNNVFEYDREPLVRLLGRAQHALEQLGGVAAGVHPHIRLLASADNTPQREAMAWLRVRLLAIVVLSLFATVCLIGWLLLRRRRPGEVTA